MKPDIEAIEKHLGLDRLTVPIHAERYHYAPELIRYRYAGGLGRTGVSRNMFDLIPTGSLTTQPTVRRLGCPACDDLSRSWNCEEHR